MVLEYLPTFTPKMAQLCRQIFHTWSIWDMVFDEYLMVFKI